MVAPRQVSAPLTKSAGAGPASVMVLMVSGAVPLLVRVRVRGWLLVWSTCSSKSSEGGAITAPGPVPAPESATDCKPPLPSSVNRRIASRPAGTAGVKVRVTLQLWAAARSCPEQVSAVLLKSAGLFPCTAADVTKRSAGPWLVRVTVVGALVVPTACEPKATLEV